MVRALSSEGYEPLPCFTKRIILLAEISNGFPTGVGFPKEYSFLRKLFSMAFHDRNYFPMDFNSLFCFFFKCERK